MNAVERRLSAIRLMELVEENPEMAEELGITVKMIIKEEE